MAKINRQSEIKSLHKGPHTNPFFHAKGQLDVEGRGVKVPDIFKAPALTKFLLRISAKYFIYSFHLLYILLVLKKLNSNASTVSCLFLLIPVMESTLLTTS